MLPEFTPPPEPCFWNVYTVVQGRFYIRVVGPSKTAFEAWKASRLKGEFGAYKYSPITEEEAFSLLKKEGYDDWL